jgi:hypothetical protein
MCQIKVHRSTAGFIIDNSDWKFDDVEFYCPGCVKQIFHKIADAFINIDKQKKNKW